MEINNSKILVTGAAGFIGSNLCEKLIKRNCSVIGIDNFNKYYDGKEENISTCLESSNFSLKNGDILDFPFIKKEIEEADIIFHLAAQPGVRFSLENPVLTNKANTEGTLNILLASKDGSKKIINASSSSVYGNPRYTPIDELHPLNPISVYGISKMSAEKYCSLFSEIYNMNIISLRFHTVYGPRGRPDMAVFRWINSLYKNQPIHLFGDGTQKRDMSYVDDIVDGCIKAAETDDIAGEIFNLAGGRVVSMNQVISILEQITEKKSEIIYEDNKTGDVLTTHASIDKAEKILQYKPKTSLENGLENTITWFKKKYHIN